MLSLIKFLKCLIIALYICFLSEDVIAQNITKFEYFIDTDPGVGLATVATPAASPAVTDFNIPISVSSLSNGFHTLYVRGQNTANDWTQTHFRNFYVLTTPLPSTDLTQIEYFVDTDPGIGAATTATGLIPGQLISNLAIDLNVSSLATGFHTLYVRGQTAAGEWTQTHFRNFYIVPLSSPLTNITQVEYFIDIDPGVGLATTATGLTPSTTVTNFPIDISATTLTQGFHTLYVRSKTADGQWTQTHFRNFYVANTSTADNLVKFEYFFDIDPGFDLGTAAPVTPPVPSVINQDIFAIPSSLSVGTHTIYVRAKDSSGDWTQVSTGSFSVTASLPPTISFFTPTSGPIGTTVTINGTDFSATPANNTVKFNGTTAIVTASTATSLTVGVPSGATTGTVSVTVGGNTATSASSFTVTPYLPFGNTIQLNGTTDYVQVADNSALRPASLTLEGWINFTSIPSYCAFFGKPYNATSSTQDTYSIWYQSGILAAGINANSNATGISLGWTPIIGQWNHVALTYDNATQIQVLYLNGVQVATGTKSAPLYDAQAFLIGSDINNGSRGGYFPGKMDEVRFWNVARTQSQIQSDINITLTGNEPGLVAYYKMDETGQGVGITVNNSATASGVTLNGTTFGTTCTTPIFTIVSSQTISSFSPSSGPIGTSITITGTNFDPVFSNNIVKFNGTTATVTAGNATSLTMTVPAGATSGTVSVTIGCSTVTSTTNFTVIPYSPLGNVVLMNGTTDLISVSDNPALRASNVTLETWVKFPSPPTTFVPIISKLIGTNLYDSYIIWYNSGRLRAIADNAVQQGIEVNFPWTPVANQWYHIAFTFDDITKVETLYINGAIVATATSPVTIAYDNSPVLIGADRDFGTLYYSAISLDETRIWNTKRTQAQLLSTMNTTLLGNEPGIVAYYKMDETGQGSGITTANSATTTGTILNGITMGTNCTPIFTTSPAPVITSFAPANGVPGSIITISGNNFGTNPINNIVKINGITALVTSTSASTLTVQVPFGATTGIISVTTCNSTVSSSGSFTVIQPSYTPCGVISLNGTSDYISVVDNTLLHSTSLTIEALVNFSSTSGYRSIVAKPYNASSSTAESFQIWYDANGIRGGVNPIDNATGIGFIWTPIIGKWYHVAFTYNNATQLQTLYLDGAEVASGTKPLPLFDANPLLIGTDIDFGSRLGYFNGKIDEVRVWNSVRTAAQIQATLSTSLAGNEAGLVAYYKLNESGQGTGITVLNSATLTGATLNGTTAGSGSTPVFTSPTIASFSPTSGNTGSTTTITGTNFDPVFSNNIVKFNGTIAIVTAGNSTSLTVTVPAGATTGTVSVTVGCYTVTSAGSFVVTYPPSNALNFDGVDDWVEVGNQSAANLASTFTLEAWVKPNASQPTGFGRIIDKFLFTLGQGYSFNFNRVTQSPLIDVWFNDGTRTVLDAVTNIADGAWHHVAATYDGNVVNMYVDFCLKASTVIGSKTLKNTTNPLRIGANTDGSVNYWFKGGIANPRVWNVWRTQAELIAGASNVPPSSSGLVVDYHFDEGGGYTTQDFSPNNLTAQLGTSTTANAQAPTWLVNQTFFTPAPLPTFSSFTPTSGNIGSTVTITGTNFDPVFSNNIVKFNGTTAIVTAGNTTSLTVTVPAGATTGTVSVTVGCYTVANAMNFILCSPPSAPSVTNGSGCISTSVALSASGATGVQQYRWYDVPSGGTSLSSTVTFTTPILATTTNYYVTIFEPAGSCESTRTTVTATINAVPPKPTITPTGSLNFCSGGNVILAAPIGFTSYVWSDGNTLQSRVVSTALTLLTVKVTNASGCQSIDSDPVSTTVLALPPQPVITGTTSFCPGGSVLLSAPASTSYLWSDGVTTQTRTETTIVTLSVKVTNANGCKSIDSAPVSTSIFPVPPKPIITQSGPNTFCQGGNVILTATTATSYLWSDGNTTNPRTVTTSFPSLTVKVTNASGCLSVDSDPTTILVNPLPNAPSISSSKLPTNGTVILCTENNETTILSTTATGVTYQWSNAQTVSSFSASQSGSYTLRVTDGNGCQSVASSAIVISKTSCKPVIASATITTTAGGKGTLSLISLITTPGTLDVASIKVVKLPASDASVLISNGVLTINYAGKPFVGTETITIEACDINGICATQDITIEVAGDIIVYNAISPNGDGKNEMMLIQNIEVIPETKENKVMIFNRWGDKVFEVENYDNKTKVFRGMNESGDALPSGTYYYKILFGSGRKEKTGFISLKK